MRKAHASQPFSGEGALRFGGRWNEVGTPVIYTSAHRSLAVLEVLVHLNGSTPPSYGYMRRDDHRLVSYNVPTPLVQVISRSELPDDWRTEPPQDATQAWGTRWARSNLSVAVAVPSSIVPDEQNLILNPRHPDFPSVTSSAPVDFVFDSRLFERHSESIITKRLAPARSAKI